MFTQFFGNYILNQGLVTSEQLAKALDAQKNTRLKLGVLAINAGYMTAEQVDIVHAEQQRVDKRIGDIMVEMGYVTREQIEELFNTQPSGHLLLGQALVDSGAMTNSQFEAALTSYKNENKISDADFKMPEDESIRNAVSSIYAIKGHPLEKYIIGYITLLFKNIVRFIGNDFAPLPSNEIYPHHCVYQKMTGPFSMDTAIITDDSSNIFFALRFAGDNISEADIAEDDEYINACVSEFLNLHNGLYAVNLSNETGAEMTLEPQETTKPDLSEYEVIDIPVCFPFGNVNFVIALK